MARADRRRESAGCGRARTTTKPGRRAVAQAGDGEAAPLRPKVLAPGRSPLDDRQVSWCDFALDANLVQCVLQHPPSAPPLYPRDVQLRQAHGVSIAGRLRPGPGRRHRPAASVSAVNAASRPCWRPPLNTIFGRLVAVSSRCGDEGRTSGHERTRSRLPRGATG